MLVVMCAARLAWGGGLSLIIISLVLIIPFVLETSVNLHRLEPGNVYKCGSVFRCHGARHLR